LARESFIKVVSLAAINVGLESFTEGLRAQDAPVIQVDWRPPVGGNEKLMAILERMKGK
jgi:FdrA protein